MIGRTLLPQILIGASNSRRTGWTLKTSLDFMHNHRISPSVKFTCRPGLAPRTLNNCSIMLSTSTSWISAITKNLARNNLKARIYTCPNSDDLLKGIQQVMVSMETIYENSTMKASFCYCIIGLICLNISSWFQVIVLQQVVGTIWCLNLFFVLLYCRTVCYVYGILVYKHSSPHLQSWPQNDVAAVAIMGFNLLSTVNLYLQRVVY